MTENSNDVDDDYRHTRTVNIIVGKTRRQRRLAVLFFASGHTSTVYFAFGCEN